jgi:hypothetical protein
MPSIPVSLAERVEDDRSQLYRCMVRQRKVDVVASRVHVLGADRFDVR